MIDINKQPSSGSFKMSQFDSGIDGYKVFLAIQRKTWRKEHPDWTFPMIHENAMVLWHSLDPKKRNRYDCQALGILQKRSLRALKHCIGLPESDSDPLQGFRAFFLDKFPSFVVHGLNFNESIPRIKSQWDILDKTLRHIYKAREERLIYADLTDDIRHIWERSQKRLERLQQFEASSGQDLFENLELSGENWTNIDAKEQHRYNERVKEYKRGFLKKVPHHNQCPQCDHVYAHFDDLALHHRSKHVFYCRVCLLTFKSYKACHSHTLHNHFYEKLPKCDLCSFRGRHPTMVLSHIVREHHHDLGLSNQEPLVSKYLRRQETFLDNLKTEAPKTPQVQDFSCQDCSTRFENGSQLKYHRTKMHSVPKPSSICRFCDKSFYTASNLRRHIRKLHSTDTSKSVIPRVPCSLCQETFVDNYRLKIHMRKHTGELPFTCGKCTFGFKTNSDLKVHGKTCLGVRFTCAKCRRVFHFKKQLREHELWSEKCGTMRNHIHVLGDHSLGGSESQPSRYMKEKPRIVRLNFSKNQSVVGVNCENLHDQSVFTKRKRKVPCGICERCERDVNCGQCGSCQAQATTNVCEERKCLSFIEQFDVVKAKQKQVAKDLGLNLYENCPDIGADLSLMNGDEEKIQLDVDDPLPKEFVLDEDELLEGPDFTLDGILAGDNASAMHHQPQNVVFYNPDHVKERILVINEEIIENDI